MSLARYKLRSSSSSRHHRRQEEEEAGPLGNNGGDGLEGEDAAFCREILVSVSRSFAAVIQALPGALVLDVCVFYLVLRALDTIEDDTSVPDVRRKQLLGRFADTALAEPDWAVCGIGAGDERRLLEEFPKVHRVYQSLPDTSRAVIADITRRMAGGMSEYVGADLLQGTRDVEEYNLYCHYVAGLVGEGLSRLFAASGLEDPGLAGEQKLSNSMGLFLQKTNIIRDFLEDYVDRRAFWPRSVWRKYGAALGDLALEENRGRAVWCLNELCTDALELVPDCLDYLGRLRHPAVFAFCAIPQVMAVATLEACYDNPDVFTGVVKIRRALSCHLMVQCTDFANAATLFDRFARSIRRRCPPGDPNRPRTLAACDAVLRRTAPAAAATRARRLRAWAVTAAAALSAAAWAVGGRTPQEEALLRHTTWLVPALVVAAASASALLLGGGGGGPPGGPKKKAAA